MLDALLHLPLFASTSDARAHLEQAARDGVSDVICGGTDARATEVAPSTASGPRVHRAFGIHPRHASDQALTEQMRALAARLDSGHAVAIGECGLDGRRGQPPLDVQERTLRAQLAIARERQLPVILHLVGTWSLALALLEEDGPLPGGGVWHAFAGPKEAIARAQALGLAFSIGGLVLQPRARRLHEALPLIAPTLLLVETDMPHDPATPLAAIVHEVARRLGEAPGDVAQRTRANGQRIFRIPG